MTSYKATAGYRKGRFVPTIPRPARGECFKTHVPGSPLCRASQNTPIKIILILGDNEPIEHARDCYFLDKNRCLNCQKRNGKRNSHQEKQTNKDHRN